MTGVLELKADICNSNEKCTYDRNIYNCWLKDVIYNLEVQYYLFKPYVDIHSCNQDNNGKQHKGGDVTIGYVKNDVSAGPKAGNA